MGCSQSAIPDLLTYRTAACRAERRCSQSAIPDLLTCPLSRYNKYLSCSQSAIPDLLTYIGLSIELKAVVARAQFPIC